MDEPYVHNILRVQSVVELQVHEEVLPDLAKASGNIEPQPLYPCVVDAPETVLMSLFSL